MASLTIGAIGAVTHIVPDIALGRIGGLNGLSWSAHQSKKLPSDIANSAEFVYGRSRYPGSVQAVLDVPAGRGNNQESSDGLRLLSIGGQTYDTSSYVSAEKRIHDVVVKKAAAKQRAADLLADVPSGALAGEALLDEAYARCGDVCAEYAKTFYLGTQLMTPERQRAIWAIYVWCRRTDELVDGPNASHITPRALDRWEERLEEIFGGLPYDMLDAALADTVRRYPADMQPFRDMIDGMRMDLRKSRYESFDELYVYCYNVAGTVGLMSVPVMGIDPKSKAPIEKVYSAALALGIANQLTNILRDVGEDIRRGRIYLPLDELAHFGLTEADIYEGKVTPKWRDFMRFQIKRAREYFRVAEEGVYELHAKSRWPVWASLALYSQILDSIEANDYDNFTKRAYVPKLKKILSLPGSFLHSLRGPSLV